MKFRLGDDSSDDQETEIDKDNIDSEEAKDYTKMTDEKVCSCL